jgi:hypothetical protein
MSVLPAEEFLMDQREYPFAKAYHQELINISETSRQLDPVRVEAPGMRDRLLIFLGDRLIAAGYKVKDQSVFYRLTEECA